MEYLKAETLMPQRNGFAGMPRLDFNAWRVLLRSNCGREVQVTAPNAFAGWMRPSSVSGFAATAAAETGTSLLYVQKLFTERGFVCSEYIYSFRLDHAAHLPHRSLRGTGQPLREVAYACGFRHYGHFARKFRHRFGDAPGALAGPVQTAGDRTVRASTGESALSAHDARPPAA
jgi:AraC-like DNA-binding protein